MKVSKNQTPIFIVGAPRSGTTLLAAMLASHNRLSCGPETRFFRFLSDSDDQQLLSSWPDQAVDFLFSISLIEPIPKHYFLSKEEIRAHLSTQPPSIPAILSAVTELFMERRGKSRWVEKSPEHLRYVRDIRIHFPNSPIVRIIRDPRDVALSIMNWPHGPDDFLEALLLWLEYDIQSADFFIEDSNSYTIKYENLVMEPREQLKKLCAFLGEGFDPEMLDTSLSSANVITEKETWKRLAAKPPDQTRVDVWKRELTTEQNKMAESLIGDRLRSSNYELIENLELQANAYPSLKLLVNYPNTLKTYVSEGFRFWRSRPGENSHLTIYIGRPDQDNWLSYQKPKRWWETLRIATHILSHKLTPRRVHWVINRNVNANLGYCGIILTSALKFSGAIHYENK